MESRVAWLTIPRVIECIPNFSEGRNHDVVDDIVGAIASVPRILLLRRESDADHNRSVVTFAGDAAAVEEAAFRGVARAVALIDLTRHQGAHPRMGAADVVPFVPLDGATMAECVESSHRVAERIWHECGVPVYYYEASARVPEHRNLADLRRGQFERIRDEIGAVPRRAPDVGLPRVHPTAGITAVGARGPLIAFNVLLDTNDITVARAIARAVRFSSGGVPFIKALGFEIRSRDRVQVSMNLVNYLVTPIHVAFDAVRHEAETRGVGILSTELIGLIPDDAMLAAASHYLRMQEFSPSRVLENRLREAVADRDA